MNEIVLIILVIVAVIAFVIFIVNMPEQSDDEVNTIFSETFTKVIPSNAIEELMTIGYRVDDKDKIEIILNLINERQGLQSELVREYENILIIYDNFDDASIDKINTIISGYKKSLEEADEIKRRISDSADQVIIEFKRIRAEKYLSLLQAISDFSIEKNNLANFYSSHMDEDSVNQTEKIIAKHRLHTLKKCLLSLKLGHYPIKDDVLANYEEILFNFLAGMISQNSVVRQQDADLLNFIFSKKYTPDDYFEISSNNNSVENNDFEKLPFLKLKNMLEGIEKANKYALELFHNELNDIIKTFIENIDERPKDEALAMGKYYAQVAGVNSEVYKDLSKKLSKLNEDNTNNKSQEKIQEHFTPSVIRPYVILLFGFCILFFGVYAFLAAPHYIQPFVMIMGGLMILGFGFNARRISKIPIVTIQDDLVVVGDDYIARKDIVNVEMGGRITLQGGKTHHIPLKELSINDRYRVLSILTPIN